MFWIRQDEFLTFSGVSAWYSVAVIHDVQNTSANSKVTRAHKALRSLAAKAREAVAPQAYAFA